MASLNGTTPAATYPSLIKFNDNSAISATKRLLSDGAGGATPIYLSSTQMNIGGTGLIAATLGIIGTGTTSATNSFITQNSSGTASFQVRDDGVFSLIVLVVTIHVLHKVLKHIDFQQMVVLVVHF